MDLTDLFESIDNPVTDKNPLVKPNEVRHFSLKAGLKDSEARIAMEKCIKSKTFVTDNIYIITKAFEVFTNGNEQSEILLDLPELADSTRVGTYKTRFVYALLLAGHQSILGLAFIDKDRLPAEQFIRWLKANGYFYFRGEMEVVKDRLESLTIHGIEYIDTKTNNTQVILPYVSL